MIGLLSLLAAPPAQANTGPPPTSLVLYDFTLSDGGFTSLGETGQWEWGVPTSGPGGPDSVWATNLSGNYLNDTTDWIDSPIVDLSASASPTLVLHHWYAISATDVAFVRAIDSLGNIVVLTPVFGYPVPGGFSGDSNGWVDDVFDLEGLGSSASFELVLSADVSGADDGWYVSSLQIVDGDAAPPRISGLTSPADTQDLVGPYPVAVTATDDNAITATLHWTVEGVESTAEMTSTGANTFEGSVPAQAPDTNVSWWVTACDGTWEASYPTPDGSFRVFLAAPTALAVLDPRPVGQVISLGWSPPDSPNPVLDYEVLVNGVPTVTATGTSVDVPVAAAAEHSFQVRARYDAGFGDLSTPLDVDVEVPTVDALTPSSAWAGERIRVDLEGDGLYLLEGSTTLSFGAGIDVVELDVSDVRHLTALLDVADDAVPGPRDVVIGGTWGEALFPAAFEVLDSGVAPAIASVTPSALHQGESVEVVVLATSPFGGIDAVEGDGELVVTAGPFLDAPDTARFQLVAASDARVGEHTIVLDDGTRLWTLPITVQERAYDVGGCATSPARGAPWSLALLIGVILRNRGRSRLRQA